MIIWIVCADDDLEKIWGTLVPEMFAEFECFLDPVCHNKFLIMRTLFYTQRGLATLEILIERFLWAGGLYNDTLFSCTFELIYR